MAINVEVFSALIALHSYKERKDGLAMINFLSFPKRPTIFALLLALLLTLNLTEIASASSLSAPQDVTPCLAATPATQTVALHQSASVRITVNCITQSVKPIVDVAWGDQTTNQYPVCIDVCPVPPLTINATHPYDNVGDFHPTICLVPSPLGSIPDCIQVEIIVIELT